jgi:hypothetical protein
MSAKISSANHTVNHTVNHTLDLAFNGSKCCQDCGKNGWAMLLNEVSFRCFARHCYEYLYQISQEKNYFAVKINSFSW